MKENINKHIGALDKGISSEIEFCNIEENMTKETAIIIDIERSYHDH
jgi:hypothetical protein